MKYKKKPVIIEAVKWTGENTNEILDFAMTGPNPLWGDDFKIDLESKTVHILTFNGIMIAYSGDWIVKNIKGEFYPCKPDIFELTYEKAE